MSQDFAVSTLYTWFKENADKFKAKDAQLEYRESGHGLGFVTIDTPFYLSELIVEDKKSRLDIEHINRDTDESIFPRLGKCESAEEFEKGLADFIEWFDEAHK